ncbi:glycosyltransferase [Saccharospirillum alexandrii]|uniref:glycosyltransferase n=1 Tax=Saccharospirillum alexandrii TaxID=2448477 RepID=UPI0037364826
MLTIAISTIDRRYEDIRLPSYHEDISYIVVHQFSGGTYSNPFVEDREDVTYIPTSARGLSLSRNISIQNCNTPYLYVMDDDVVFDVDKMLHIIELMKLENVQIATCRHIRESGLFPKKYKSSPYDHNFLTAAKVSSIDICISHNDIKKQDIKFDERFGLGAEYPSGEEYIFLTDCMKHGLKVRYFPLTVGTHPEETSGLDFYSSSKKIIAKREMFKRIFGWVAPLYIFAFWAKKIIFVRRMGYGYMFTKTLLFGIE